MSSIPPIMPIANAPKVDKRLKAVPETAPCCQVKVPASGPVMDRGARSGAGKTRLTRIFHHTPCSGEYYCQEKSALYVFARADFMQGVTITYTDVKAQGRGEAKNRVHEVRVRV